MGIGPPIISLYHQMARDGLLNNIHEVINLGSQDIYCPGYENLLNSVFTCMGRPSLSNDQILGLANGGPAREFYEWLGWTYNCIDTDGRHGALVLDLNYDGVPNEHLRRYDLTTNYGTTEHLINQLNAFRVLHDLTKQGGLIVHILPFVGCVNHGFFTYQPSFFNALAKFNSYEVLGMWFNLNTSLPSLIPWHSELLQHIHVSPLGDSVLVVVTRKMFDAKFCVPFQNIYEFEQIDSNLGRYQYIVDGDLLNGNRIARVSNQGFAGLPNPDGLVEQISWRALFRELVRRFSRPWRRS